MSNSAARQVAPGAIHGGRRLELAGDARLAAPSEENPARLAAARHALLDDGGGHLEAAARGERAEHRGRRDAAAPLEGAAVGRDLVRGEGVRSES